MKPTRNPFAANVWSGRARAQSAGARGWVCCIVLLAILAASCLTTSAAGSFQILVFSYTPGYRHVSIPDGIAAIKDLGALNNFDVIATEDPSVLPMRVCRRSRQWFF